MKRLNSLTGLFSRSSTPSSSKRYPATELKLQQFERYVDGYAYRRLASQTQAVSAIQGFFREFAGRDANPEDVLNYVQEWNQGRSLRSIRDEIAKCPDSQCWG